MKNVILIFMTAVAISGCVGASQSVTSMISKMDYIVKKSPEGTKVLPDSEKAEKEVLLQLNTSGHTGSVYTMLPADGGKEMVSFASDNTIRVWDTSTGRQKRKILGYIEKEVNFSRSPIMPLRSIDLSKNDKYLAAVYGSDDIRIYDYASGKMLMVLKPEQENKNYGLMNAVFSNEGKYLIATDASSRLYIWNTDGFTLEKKIDYGIGVFTGIYMDDSQPDPVLYSAGTYQVCAHSYNQEKILNCYRPAGNGDIVSGLSFGTDIATSLAGKKIVILDRNMRYKTAINLPKITDLTNYPSYKYSSDGRFLMVLYNSELKVYDSQSNYSLTDTMNIPVKYFSEFDGKIYGSNIENPGITSYDMKTGAKSLSFEYTNASINSVTLKGDKLYYGRGRNLSNVFDLDTMTISKASVSASPIGMTEGAYSIKPVYDKVAKTSGMHIFHNGKDVGNTLNPMKQSFAGIYGGYIFTAYELTGGVIYVYDLTGKHIGYLVGHEGAVTSISGEGKRLLTADNQGSVRLWDLSDFDTYEPEINEKAVEKAIAAAKRINEKIGLKSVTKDMTKEEFVKNLKNSPILLGMYQTKLNMRPLLSIFIDGSNEWVAWTDDGYFDSTPKGASYVGFHINEGRAKEAEFVSVDKFYNTFYRPDIVQKTLAGDTIEIAKVQSVESILEKGLAPEVSILTGSQEASARDITLKLQICDKNGGYNNLTLMLDGMAVDVMSKDRALSLIKPAQTEKCFTVDKLISLQNGDNVIGFKATNEDGSIESNTAEIHVSYMKEQKVKPNLFIMTIAIDRYRDGDLWLKYSKDDAKGILREIKHFSAPLFEHVYSFEMQDAQATKENMLKMFETIGKKTTRGDVFILYVAGHGITDKLTGEYFYLPVDFRYSDDDSVRKLGFSQNDFKLGLSKIQAMKSLTMLDTCNSGSFAEALASRGVLQKTAISKLTRATGRATIVASSKDQVALEGYNGHGVFTYTLIEAFREKAYGSDNRLTIKELAAYVEDVLPDRTYQKWGYEQIPQSHITGNDFPIAVR